MYKNGDRLAGMSPFKPSAFNIYLFKEIKFPVIYKENLNLYMDTLIVQPKSKEQLTALKAVMKALKIDFKTEKGNDKAYNAEFVAKMTIAEDDVKAGRTTKIEPTDIWNLE